MHSWKSDSWCDIMTRNSKIVKWCINLLGGKTVLCDLEVRKTLHNYKNRYLSSKRKGNVRENKFLGLDNSSAVHPENWPEKVEKWREITLQACVTHPTQYARWLWSWPGRLRKRCSQNPLLFFWLSPLFSLRRIKATAFLWSHNVPVSSSSLVGPPLSSSHCLYSAITSRSKSN